MAHFLDKGLAEKLDKKCLILNLDLSSFYVSVVLPVA